MRAAVLWKSGAPFDVTTVELEDHDAHEVLVQIAGVGVCHSDLIARSPSPPPMILGHEGAGVVVAIGSAVSSVAVGDHVLATFDWCGRCRACLTGHPAYCVEFEKRNLTGTGLLEKPATTSDGAKIHHRWFSQSSFAEYAVCTERNLIVVDSALPLELIGPLGCGFQTGAGAVFNDLHLSAGQSIAIFGAGAVGLAAAMAAKICGAEQIVVIDQVNARLDRAMDMGATRVVRGSATDLVQDVTRGGPGVDFAIDTTSAEPCMRAAIEVLDRPGRAVLLGGGAKPFPVTPASLNGRELTFVLMGDSVPHVFVPQLIDYWKRGLFPFDQLVRTYPLEEINRAATDSLDGTTIKPILIP
jgi:aryl-alcohol dehydrogenase